MKWVLKAAGAALLLNVMPASAGIDVYGVADVSLTYSDNNAQHGEGVSLDSNKSRLGIKGDEDLTDSLKAVWQIEGQVDFDTGVSSSGDDEDNFGIKARNTFLGLEGGFGSLLGGRYDSPYKKVSDDLDVFSNSHADYNAIIGRNKNGVAVHDYRPHSTIQYHTPKMAGVSLALAYMVDETRDSVGDSGYAVGLSYNKGAWLLGLAQEVLSEQSSQAAGKDDKGVKFGARYAFSDTTAAALIWESQDAGNGGRDAWYVNVAHRINAYTWKFAYGQADDTGALSDTGASHYALGLWGELSSNTSWYAVYADTNNEAAALYGLDRIEAGGVGANVSVFALGLQHRFASRR